MWPTWFLLRLISVPFSKYQCDFRGAQGDQRVMKESVSICGFAADSLHIPVLNFTLHSISKRA